MSDSALRDFSDLLEHRADICIIEDDASTRALLRQYLSRAAYHVIEASDGVSGLRQIYAHRPRIVLCDMHLPEIDGVQICRRVRGDPTLDGVYFLMFTASRNRKVHEQALVAGADDYLQKPYSAVELHAHIRIGMRYHRMQERLRRAALTDGLTELWNHAKFRTILDREFARAARYGGPLSLIMIDLDHFKAVNDTYGHEVGNQVLRLTARHLERSVRQIDTVARYGGEEFVVICPETTLEEATGLAERLRVGLPHAARLDAFPNLRITASMGIASSTLPGVHSAMSLIDFGDRALYIAKHYGRDRVIRGDEAEAGVASQSPPVVREISALRHQVRTMSLRSKDLCLQSIWALIQALDARDPMNAAHARNVTQYTSWLFQAGDWDEALRVPTVNAAILHDLGKIGLTDEVLLQPRPLTEAELALAREVPLLTCRILEPLRVFDAEVQIIRHIREHYDGGGYPDGLRDEQIPLGARIVCLAEAFDSITSSHSYRAGRSLDEALRELAAAAGRQFDPALVELLQAAVNENRAEWQTQIMQTHANPSRRPPYLSISA